MSAQVIDTVFYLVSQWQLASAATFSCALVIATHYYIKNCYTFWSSRGIKGPKPLPLIGNVYDLLFRNRFQVQAEWREKYGKVYGIYLGLKPKLIVSEAETIVQVCIKDFDAFPNHDNKKEHQGKYIGSFIFNQVDEHWKKVRALLSPTFTSGKIKRMFKLLDGCADDMVQLFHEQFDGEKKVASINVRDLYGLYTMDGISTCCYELKLNRAGSSNLKTAATRDEMVESALKLFNISYWRFFIVMVVPKFILKAINFHVLSETNMEPMARKMRALIKKRQNYVGPKKSDYLQSLIDAKVDESLELNLNDSSENHHACLTSETLQEDQRKLAQEVDSKAVLSELEVLSSAMFLITVGLDTTSTLLSALSFALAFHQDIQDKLYDELIKISHRDESTNAIQFDYDSLTGCHYLDAVVSETLRLLPPAYETERQARRDYRLEKYGLNLPEGIKVSVAIQVVHGDPDYWEEPKLFKPERFLPHNRDKIVTGSYCPFGIGPRHCLGMRFSLTEAKLGIAKIITNFRLKPAPGTYFPPEPQIPLVIYRFKTPNVLIEARV